MTDVAPAEGVTEGTPPAPAATETEAAPTSGELRLSLRENVIPLQEEHHSADQPRAKDGTFVDPEATPGDEGEAQDVPGEEAAPDAAETGTVEAAEADQSQETPSEEPPGRSFADSVPPEWEMVALPEGHPLRDRGITEWPAIPGFENETRNLVSQAIRRRELESVRDANTATERQLVEAKVEIDFWVERTAMFLKNPEVSFKIQQLQDEHGPEVAEAYVERVLREGLPEMAERVKTAGNEFTETQVSDEAGRFVSAARVGLAGEFSDLSLNADEINNVIAGYGQLLADGKIDKPHASTLYKYAESVLANHPARVAAQTAETEASRAADIKAAVAKEVARLRAEEGKPPVNPVGHLAPGSAPVDRSETILRTSPHAVDREGVPNIGDMRGGLRNQPMIGGE